MLKLLGAGSAIAILLLLIIGWGNGQEPIEKESYVVQKGDTLWNLSNERWQGDTREGVWWMREENNLESPVIHPGQILFVPKKEE